MTKNSTHFYKKLSGLNRGNKYLGKKIVLLHSSTIYLFFSGGLGNSLYLPATYNLRLAHSFYMKNQLQ